MLQKTKECWFCHTTENLHRHEIFFGSANRKKSIQYGMQVWLCGTHHNMSGHSVHHDREMDLRLKRWGQEQFELTHTREEFMNIFHRNYLGEKDQIMEFEFIKEKVRPIGGKNNAYVEVMYRWLESDNKTLKFKCKSEQEMKSVANSAYQFRRKNNLDFTVFKRANLCEVYLVRA